MTEAVQQSLINAVPTIIGSLAAAWVVVRRVNKKTDEKANETNEIVAAKTEENSKKLDQVHATVNGNLSAERARAELAEAKLDAVIRENHALRAKQSEPRSKRSTDV